MPTFTQSRLTQLTTQMKPNLDRRHFLKTGIAACTLFALPQIQTVNAALLPMHERKLAFLNLHTGERIHTAYWAEGQYLLEGLSAIANVLRDHRSGEVHEIDRSLLEMLQLLSYKMAYGKEFHVISGYRSPATNAKLNAKSNGVAKRSLHMQGKAIDIRLPGHALAVLHETALSLQAGGVGYYPKSDFIHLDTGRVRNWSG